MVESNEKSKFTYYCFMRHGQRADFVSQEEAGELPFNSKIQHDPPLTAKGK